MDKVFEVTLFIEKNDHDYYAELELPATPYELLDAMERIRYQEGDNVSCEIQNYGQFNFLCPVMESNVNSLELNALAQRLVQLDEEGQIAFEALVRAERDKGVTTCPLGRLVDLAYSTDCCDVYPGVSSYQELGRHYFENDQVPELKDIPESGERFVNFEQIGRTISEGEGGILTSRGYVIQTEDLKEVFQTLDLSLQKPDYTILLDLTYGREHTTLRLPADSLTMDDVLEQLDASDFGNVEVKCLDCTAPALIPFIGNEDNVAHINRLAGMLQEIDPAQLTKFKAVLEATGEQTVLGATNAAYTLDQYRFSPQFVSSDDVARRFLECEMEPDAVKTLLPHVNLYEYGEALLKKQEAKMTWYGLVSRADGQNLQLSPNTAKAHEMGGMTMQ